MHDISIVLRPVAFAGLSLNGNCRADGPFLHAPSVDTYAKHDPNGRTILSTGRYLQPIGRHLPVARFPYGLAMSRMVGRFSSPATESGS